MQVYRVFNTDAEFDTAEWLGTRLEAHDRAKTMCRLCKHLARIELHDVPSDKVTIIALLNGYTSQVETKVMTTWALTPRGGMKEVPNGE